MAPQLQARRNIRFNDVNTDLPSNMLDEPFYSHVTNMEPADVGLKSSAGTTPIYGAPLFPPEQLLFVRRATTAYWIYASSDGIGVTDGVNHFDITPVAGVTALWPTTWTATNLNGLAVLNDIVDMPIWWDGQTGNVMQPLPGWPANTSTAAIRAFKNNLIALDIRDVGGEFSNQVMWSDNAAPGQIPTQWTPLPENSAGAVLLADTPGNCVDGQQLRDGFFIFKDSSMYIMSFIGGNQVFSFRKFASNTGILAPNCATEYLNKMLWMSDGDIIISDGARLDSLIDRRMRKFVFNNIDSNNYKNAFVSTINKDNQVWFCFPESGATDCTIALVWDANDNKFGIRDLIPTPSITLGLIGDQAGAIIDWDSDNQAWDLDDTTWNETAFNATQDAFLQADRINTKLLAVNDGSTSDGAIIPHRVQRTGLTFDNEDAIKLIRAVWPRVTGNAGITLMVSIGASDTDQGAINWSQAVPFIIGTDFKVDTFARGRFIAVKIEAAIDQPQWRVQGIDFTWSVKGRF